MKSHPPPAKRDDALTGPLRARGTLMWGLFILAMFFGAGGIWAVHANIDSAVIAGGELVMEGNRIRVQHLEGGIVDTIAVDDGYRVVVGDPLIGLEQAAARAQVVTLRAELFDALGRMARLRAERGESATIVFPERLLEAAGFPGVADVLRMQEDLFRSRRRAFDGQKEILAARIPQYQSMIEGLNGQISALGVQLATLDEEIDIVEGLLDKGIARRPRLLQLRRNAAAVQGEIGDLIEKRAQTRLAISEIEMRLIDLDTTRLASIEEELTPLLSRVIDLEDRLRAAEDRLERTVVRAPVSGVVVGLSVHNSGAVVQPGHVLLSIVPDGAAMVAHARVSPVDVDLVAAGQSARVVLSAFKQNIVPPLLGRVRRISADRLEDGRTGEPFFEVVVDFELEGEELNGDDRLLLVPGMPAEIFIRTGSRTPLEYLLQPLRDSFRRALRET